MINWLRDNSKDADIAVSTRARIARNVAGVPFPNRISSELDIAQVTDVPREVFTSKGSDFKYIDMSQLSAHEKAQYLDMHIASKELCNSRHGSLITSPDSSISLMMLEEDHYRIQSLKGGFEPEETYNIASSVEKMLSKKVEYAHSDRFGYLTACPSNVGTGLRIGTMLHLKGLKMGESLHAVLNNLGRLGFSVRGVYGEGTSQIADCYQISNERTYGLTDEEIINNVRNVVGKMINQEREVRRILYKNNRDEMEDRVLRAYGILKHCRKITYKEAAEDLSLLALGISLGILNPCTQETVYRLLMELTPAMVSDGKMSDTERDLKRAKIIQSNLD